MKYSLCFCDLKDGSTEKIPNSDTVKLWILNEDTTKSEVKGLQIILSCLVSIEIVKDVKELMGIYSELTDYHCCGECISNSSKIAKSTDLTIDNDSIYLGKILVKMIFLYNELYLTKDDKFTLLLLEIVKYCISTKQSEIESDGHYDVNSIGTDSKSNLGEYISLIISFVMIQILLGNYEYSFAILDYIGKKYPSVTFLLDCLRKSIDEIPTRSRKDIYESGDCNLNANSRYSKAFQYYPNIINCLVRSILTLYGVNLNASPAESILINNGGDKSTIKARLISGEIYTDCMSALGSCYESGGICTNFELEYSLSRLYFEIENDIDKSIEIVKGIIEKSPFNENYRVYYGKLLCNKAVQIYCHGDLKQVKSLLKKAAMYIPNSSDIYNDLAIIYSELGKKNKAIWCFELSINFNPQNVNTYNNFGIFLRKMGYIKESILCYEKIIGINPKCVNSLNITAALYNTTGQVDLAYECFKKCIQLNPNDSDVFNNLGVLYRDTGNFVLAKKCFLIAININKKNVLAYQNLVYILNYFVPVNIDSIKNKFEEYSKDKIADEICLKISDSPKSLILPECNTQISTTNMSWLLNSDYYVHYEDMITVSSEWGDYFTELYREAKSDLDKTSPIANVPMINENDDSLCEIKIGFVGAEFFHHAVGFFIYSPLYYLSKKYSTSCDRNVRFETYIYDNSPYSDYLSDRFKELVPPSNWRDIRNRDAISVSKLIREDGIHILFDLSGHTVNNSLAVFAFKNSPIQISWIGYPNTTGLKYIDYKITDSISDPINTKQKYSEKLIYLPNSFLCFAIPQTEYPIVGELPLKTNGYVTFGSFNRLTKLHPITIDLWGQVLKRVKNSRLILKSKAFTSTKCQSFYTNIFCEKYGVEKERLMLLPLSNTYYSHLDLYNKVDISLDTFPYSGTTTTFECIFMGVPLITFCIGDNLDPKIISKDNSELNVDIVPFHSQNVGKSILYNLGLEEFITYTKDQFIDAAVGLAKNTKKLSLLRSTLRDTLKNSNLCNGEVFTRDFTNLMVDIIRNHKN